MLHVKLDERHSSAVVLQSRLWLDESKPVGGVSGQQPHAVALIEGQGHVGQVAQEVHDALPSPLGALGHLRSHLCCEYGLDGSDQHHADHHDGENGDRVARHVHDEQVHGNLWEPKGYFSVFQLG